MVWTVNVKRRDGGALDVTAFLDAETDKAFSYTSIIKEDAAEIDKFIAIAKETSIQAADKNTAEDNVKSIIEQKLNG